MQALASAQPYLLKVIGLNKIDFLAGPATAGKGERLEYTVASPRTMPAGGATPGLGATIGAGEHSPPGGYQC